MPLPEPVANAWPEQAGTLAMHDQAEATSAPLDGAESSTAAAKAQRSGDREGPLSGW
jgi:hypothetical protein